MSNLVMANEGVNYAYQQRMQGKETSLDALLRLRNAVIYKACEKGEEVASRVATTCEFITEEMLKIWNIINNCFQAVFL